MNNLSSVPKLGVWAWSFVGVVVATAIVVTALAAVSEIVLPLMFAAVLPWSSNPSSGASNATASSPPLPPAWSSSACSP